MLIDELQELLTAKEQAVLWRAFRLFFGHFGPENAPIQAFAAGDFTKGVWVGEQQVMGKCGMLSENAIRRAIKSLVQAGVLLNTGRKTQKGVMYSLQTNADDYQWDWLKKRQATNSYSNQATGAKKRTPSHPRLKSSDPTQPVKARWTDAFDGRDLYFARLRRVVNINQANALLDHLGPEIETVIVKQATKTLTAVPSIGKDTAATLMAQYSPTWQPSQESAKPASLQQRSNKAAALLCKKVNPDIDDVEFYREYKAHLHKYDDDQIVRCAQYLATEPYFKTRAISPRFIRTNIHTWIERGMPAIHQNGSIADLVTITTPQNGRVNERSAAMTMYGIT